MKLDIPVDLARAIETEINAICEERRPAVDRNIIQQQRVLPLYSGWAAAICIKPSGEIVIWWWDLVPDDKLNTFESLESSYWIRMGLHQGAQRYPFLAPLVPARDPTATDCEACGGEGFLMHGQSKLICKCGGCGWTVPGEDVPDLRIG